MKALLLAAMLMHGIVLAVDPKAGTTVVKHDAFGGMPAMTMTFAVSPRDAARLHVGDDVRGSVDMGANPWKLRVKAVSAALTPKDTGAAPPVAFLAPGEPVPDEMFTDQLGRMRSWQEFRGHVTVVSFIYTRCKDASMCPLVSAKFEQMQSLLPADARLLEFTLDPAYDVPPVLLRYGRMFGADPARWTIATGNPATLDRIAQEFGIGISAHAGSSLVHSEVLGIVDASGNLVKIVAGNTWQPDEVDAAVRDAEGLASNLWERLVLGVRHAVRQCGLGDMSLQHAAEMLIFIGAIVAIAVVALIADLFIRRRRRGAGSS
jgi:cytochrome oxidase Cu insertion factor (SCO1/SenC/PrrC family)